MFEKLRENWDLLRFLRKLTKFWKMWKFEKIGNSWEIYDFLKMENGLREIRTTRAKFGKFGRNAALICEALGERDQVEFGLSAHPPKHHPQPLALVVWEFSIPNLPNTTSNLPLHSSNFPSPPLPSLNTANIQHQGVAPSPLCSPVSICFPISVNHCLFRGVLLLVFSSFSPPSFYPCLSTSLPFACFFAH